MLFSQRFTTQLLPKLKRRAMSVFVHKPNRISGTMDWVEQSEDYDYHQEVARSSFADMLHDTERNQLYERALIKAINTIHARGAKANVLDIGTGTGLLSMMACRAGADVVVACEAFAPMSECARKIIQLNGYSEKIQVIPKRSTELELEKRCNILVTEVFDTELIGEGAVGTFTHALEHLLEPNCIVVPSSATVFAQVVESPLVQNWNKLKDYYSDEGDILVRVPKNFRDCPGSAAVHDVQLTQLPREAFKSIVNPTAVLRFDWSNRGKLEFNRKEALGVTAVNSGKAQVVFMWWELKMDEEEPGIVLSCAPAWAQGDNAPWRDHWMQAVYYLPEEISVNKGDKLQLLSCHDEYSLWFSLHPPGTIPKTAMKSPVCTCGVHVAFSRTRLGQINDHKRRKKHLRYLEKTIKPHSCVLILSHGFYSALVASKLGASRVIILETYGLCQRILREFIEVNSLRNVEIIEALSEGDLSDVDLVVGEPYFVNQIYPWDALHFAYLLKEFRKKYNNENLEVSPKKMVVKCLGVLFDDLHKIRTPLRSCEGFKMAPFDELIEKSMSISDDHVEPQPLWEYPAIAVTDTLTLATFDLTSLPDKTFRKSDKLQIKSQSECNGVAVWVEWWLDEDEKNVINTGPVEPPQLGEKIEWDMYTRQGVCLFENRRVAEVPFSFHLDFADATVAFRCN